MLLAIDIGNSTVSMGIFEGQQLTGHGNLPTDPAGSDEEYAALTRGMLDDAKIQVDQVGDVIVSTVVPELAPTFVAMTQRLFHRPAIVVSSDMDSGLTLRYHPKDLGTDRLANAAATYARYRTDAIVVDLGTATTFSLVTAAGEFLGGAIAPGLSTGADALVMRTARLPKVQLVPPTSPIGTDTIGSLQSGVVLGHSGMVDHLVSRMQQQLGRSTRVIATGGWASLIAPISQSIQEVRPFLTLEGLEYLYRRQGTRR